MKHRILVGAFLFFTLFNFQLNAVPTSTWIVNPDKISCFGSDKQKWLADALSKSHIHIAYDKNLNVIPADLIPSRPQTLTSLVEGKHASIYLITPSLEELHIGIVVKDMLALKGNGLKEFRKMLKHVAFCFQSLGYGDYLAFCDFGKKYQLSSGKIMKGQCWEMIPLGKNCVASKSGEYLLAPKIWRNNYVLFNQTPEFKKVNPTVVSQFIKFFRSHLKEDNAYPCYFCHETLPWKIHIRDLKNARKMATDRMLVTLKQFGAVQISDSSDVQKSNSLSTNDDHNEAFNCYRNQDRKTCAFCDQAVLKKQGMIHSQGIRVIYNRNAYSKNAHFMIIPQAHQESLHCLDAHQLKNAIQWAQKISFVLDDKKNLVWFCQNGPRAGQTVPHSHIHVLRRPNPLYFSMLIFNELASNTLKPYGEKEFQTSRLWIHSRLTELGYNAISERAHSHP